MCILYSACGTFLSFFSYLETSTSLYRSCAALASFSGTFDSILFKQLILKGLVWFSLDRRFKKIDKINGFWFALIQFFFSLVLFAYSTDTQTNKQLFQFN